MHYDSFRDRGGVIGVRGYVCFCGLWMKPAVGSEFLTLALCVSGVVFRISGWDGGTATWRSKGVTASAGELWCWSARGLSALVKDANVVDRGVKLRHDWI